MGAPYNYTESYLLHQQHLRDKGYMTKADAQRLHPVHLEWMGHTNGTRATGHPGSPSAPPLMGVLLIYAILLTMVGAQVGLFWWKKKHQRSYDLVTLAGLWLMPPFICVQLKFWRFLLVWAIYSGISGYLFSLCSQRQRLELSTPRKVYTWFLGVYMASKVVGVVGYIMLLAEVVGAGPLIRMLLPANIAIDLIWYGIYFGVLGRDCAEVATDRMASVMGSQGRRLVSTVSNCGICNNELQDFSHLGGEQATQNETVQQLSCKHCFHDLCIRGWTMVGKKDTCPVCNEKVDLRALYADRPWETRNLTWIQMLDTVRYLVVWNPLIFMCLSVVFHYLFPPPHPDQQHLPPGFPAVGGLQAAAQPQGLLAGALPPGLAGALPPPLQ